MRGGRDDPRRAYYLTSRTERLPYAMAPRPQLARIQVVAHVVSIILMVLAILSLIALDVVAVIVYLNYDEIVKFLIDLRRGY
jgi:hypothetical protein